MGIRHLRDRQEVTTSLIRLAARALGETYNEWESGFDYGPCEDDPQERMICLFSPDTESEHALEMLIDLRLSISFEGRTVIVSRPDMDPVRYVLDEETPSQGALSNSTTYKDVRRAILIAAASLGSRMP
jgi:hypothetical protein